MSKKSFVQMLTYSDIVEILRRNNLRIKLDVPQPLMRGKDEYGNKITVKCEHIEETEESKLLDYMGGALFRNLGAYGAVFSETAKKYSAYGGDEIIDIGDYYMVETISLKSDEDAREYMQKLTDSYHEYMTEKFGEVYSQKAEEFFNKLKNNNQKDDDNLEK